MYGRAAVSSGLTRGAEEEIMNEAEADPSGCQYLNVMFQAARMELLFRRRV